MMIREKKSTLTVCGWCWAAVPAQEEKKEGDNE